MAEAGRSERGSASSDYDLLARLAAGGMAEIFLARANSLAGLERYVVLKRIRPVLGTDPHWVTMFLDEARLAAQLQHPNIAQVFDLGRIGEDYFYTMEYVHGDDVLEILERSNELAQSVPVQVVLAIMVGATAGLAHAHQRCGADGLPLGIVHRDISPSNLMVSFEGTVKVVDFGIARASLRRTETQAGILLGKLAYMSPEQTRTSKVDHRSDIFSLGIVLWELLTMERLFKRDSDYETLQALHHHDPPLPSTIAPHLPAGLDAVVMRALERDPERRFQSMTEMQDALEQVAEGAGIALTGGVLRRYMHSLFGARPEPWRDIDLTDDAELIEEGSRSRSMHGFPVDVPAERVPLLGHTGLIDVEALSDVIVSSPRPPSGVYVHPRMDSSDGDDLPTPLRVATGSSRVIDASMLVPPDPQPIVMAPALPRPRSSRRKSVITICATVAALLALALALYPVLTKKDARPPRVEPIVTPLEVHRPPQQPAAVVSPIEEAPKAPAVIEKKPRTKPAAKKQPPRPDVKPTEATETTKKCADPLDCQF